MSHSAVCKLKIFCVFQPLGVFTNKFDKSSENGLTTDYEEKHSIDLGTTNRWRIARNRWNLAYTLLNNPSLSQYRKQNLESCQDEEEYSKDEETEMEVASEKKDLSKVPNDTTPAVSI